MKRFNSFFTKIPEGERNDALDRYVISALRQYTARPTRQALHAYDSQLPQNPDPVEYLRSSLEIIARTSVSNPSMSGQVADLVSKERSLLEKHGEAWWF